MNYNDKITSIIKKRMKLLNINQNQIHKKHGVCFVYLSKVLRGQHKHNLKNTIIIFRALNIPMEVFDEIKF